MDTDLLAIYLKIVGVVIFVAGLIVGCGLLALWRWFT